MSIYLTDKLKGLKPYVPGEQPNKNGYIKLNTNESPYPPSPKIKDMIDAAELEDLRLYSDPDLKKLISTISKYYSVNEDCVFCGNGSDEVLSFAFLAWGDKGVVYPDISYGFYEVFADLYGLIKHPIPLNKDFTIDLTKYDDLGSLIVVANPNAPTGISVSVPEIEHLLERNPESVIVIDEAYVDFGAESALPLVNKYDNLLVVRTFSKSRQLAGARLGYAFGNRELISDLNRIKFSFNPYNVNRLTAIAGAVSIEDDEWFKDCIIKTVSTRDRLTNRLRDLGFFVLESKANFVFAKHDHIEGKTLYEKLKNRGILVRHFDKARISEFNRITVGTDAETDVLIETISDILKEL